MSASIKQIETHPFLYLTKAEKTAVGDNVRKKSAVTQEVVIQALQCLSGKKTDASVEVATFIQALDEAARVVWVKQHCFLQLDADQQAAVSKRASSAVSMTASNYGDAIDYLGCQLQGMRPEIVEIVKALDQEAEKFVRETREKWKADGRCVTQLNGWLRYGRRAALLVGGCAVVGEVGLVYLRMQKLLILANACLIIASFVLGSLCLKSHAFFEESVKIINAEENDWKETISSVETCYKQFVDSHAMIWFYTLKQERPHRQGDKVPKDLGLKFLSAHAEAFKKMKSRVGLGS